MLRSWHCSSNRRPRKPGARDARHWNKRGTLRCREAVGFPRTSGLGIGEGPAPTQFALERTQADLRGFTDDDGFLRGVAWVRCDCADHAVGTAPCVVDAMSAATASATLIPSTAAERIP